MTMCKYAILILYLTVIHSATFTLGLLNIQNISDSLFKKAEVIIGLCTIVNVPGCFLPLQKVCKS